MLIHILSAWMLNAFQVVSTPQYKKKKNQKQPNIRKVETNEQWAHHKITWLYYLSSSNSRNKLERNSRTCMKWYSQRGQEWKRQKSKHSHIVRILPVSTFKLGTQEGVLKIKGDTLSRWSPFRDFRQAKHNPRVNFSKTELSFERQCIHWPMTGWKFKNKN